MTDFEALHPRQTSGQFTDKHQSAPQVSLSATPPATSIGPRIIATVQLQYWRNDYAIDADGPITFDATDIIADMTSEQRADLKDQDYQSDEIYFEAVRRGLAKEHDGPFYVNVTDAIEGYDEALAEPELGEFLFGSLDDLNADQLATIAFANTLFPGMKPGVSVHDADHIDVIYADINYFEGDATVRVRLNSAGEVTGGGPGEFWEDNDPDHPKLDALFAVRGRRAA